MTMKYDDVAACLRNGTINTWYNIIRLGTDM